MGEASLGGGASGQVAVRYGRPRPAGSCSGLVRGGSIFAPKLWLHRMPNANLPRPRRPPSEAPSALALPIPVPDCP